MQHITETKRWKEWYEIIFLGGQKLKIDKKKMDTALDSKKSDKSNWLYVDGKYINTDQILFISEPIENTWTCPSGKQHSAGEDCDCGTLVLPAPKN